MAARRLSAEQLTIPERDVLVAIINDLTVGMKADIVQLLVSGALAINGAGNAAAKIGAAIYACALSAAGVPVLVTKAANTAMAALAGTVTNAKFNVFCFFVDSAGTLTTLMGTEGATLGAVVFPTFPDSKACIGLVIVNPTGTGNFIGGTTPLDDATVVPNAVYINTIGAFKPTSVATIVP